MIPSAKIVALIYLLVSVQRGSVENNEQRIRLYRMVELIGRWSMVDVFVDTFTAALVQLQPLMSVEPGPGLLFFGSRGADDARGRIVRPPAHLGCSQRGGGATCLRTKGCLTSPSRGTCPGSGPGSPSSGSSRSWRRSPASGSRSRGSSPRGRRSPSSSGRPRGSRPER